tara:strand:- start:2307 stop:3113 length:807 start_codon:yes stop_codon:yes gene_type:complete
MENNVEQSVEVITFTSTSKKRKGALIIENPANAIIKHKTSGKVLSKRKIRYYEGCQSIYIDEQIKLDPDAEATPIVIGKKNLRVDKNRDPLMVEFLKANPHFDMNTATGFRILDVAQDDLYELEAYELTQKAKNIVLEKDKEGHENLIRTMVIEFISVNAVLNTTLPKMKKKLLIKIETEQGFVEKIIKFAENTNNNEKLIISMAIKENIIAINDGKTVTWKESGEQIYVASQSQNAISDFATWLKIDKEGRQYLSAISDKLPKKEKE